VQVQLPFAYVHVVTPQHALGFWGLLLSHLHWLAAHDTVATKSWAKLLIAPNARAAARTPLTNKLDIFFSLKRVVVMSPKFNFVFQPSWRDIKPEQKALKQ